MSKKNQEVGRKARTNMSCLLLSAATALATTPGAAQVVTTDQAIAAAVKAVDADVRAWRHDFHSHPELSNREVRTATKVAKILTGLGLEVKTGVANTGVVALLRGARPGPTVAYRADMDATFGPEDNDLPFKSTASGEFMGQRVPIAHLCGHDAHTAMLLGVAKVLTGMRGRISGNVMFIFQPAEEGHVPPGELVGARLMLKEDVFGLFGNHYRPAAIFGLHVLPREAGSITFREKSLLGSSGIFEVRLTPATASVRGHDITKEAAPADPVAAMAEIITALKNAPALKQEAFAPQPRIGVQDIKTTAGFRDGNMAVTMRLSVRVYDKNAYQPALDWINGTIDDVSKRARVKAEVNFIPYAPVLYNDPGLVRQMRPTIAQAVGEKNIIGDYYFFPAADDVALFQEQIPGIFIFLGVNKEGLKTGETPSNHTPKFFVNEDTFQVGVRVMTSLGIDYLKPKTGARAADVPAHEIGAM